MVDTFLLELTPTYDPAGADIDVGKAEKIKVPLQPILRGEKGDPGNSASRYVHTQSLASAIWTVPHNLNARPSVMVADHLGNQIFADVFFVDQNIVQITHSSAITGFVYCN